MRQETKDKIDRVIFDSWDDLVDTVGPYLEAGMYPGRSDDGRSWTGATDSEALAMARNGWDDPLPDALAIAESAVTQVETEIMGTTFESEHGVAGSDVDIGRYLTGEPECMVEYPLVEIPRTGRIITLCASVCYSAGIPEKAIMARGQVLTALAFALTRMGFSCEMWADASTNGRKGHGGSVRVMVKGANDLLDPARIMFAYAHPAMLRRVLFAGANNVPNGDQYEHNGDNGGMWMSSVANAAETLPEGTIYLPGIDLRDNGSADPANALRALLREIGVMGDTDY